MGEVLLHFGYSSAMLQSILSILCVMILLQIRILRRMLYSLRILSPKVSFHLGEVGLSLSSKSLTLGQAKAVAEGWLHLGLPLLYSMNNSINAVPGVGYVSKTF